MMLNFANHYWIIGGADIYSSKTNTRIAADDADYVAWTAGNTASPIASEAELADVLKLHNCLPAWLFNASDTFIQPTPTTYSNEQLAAYAADARYRCENRGLQVTSISASLFTSDVISRNAVDTAWAYMNAKGTTNSISWKMADGSFITMTTAQVTTVMNDITAFVQSCFDCEAATVTAIGAGTTTMLSQIDDAFAAVPNVFP